MKDEKNKKEMKSGSCVQDDTQEGRLVDFRSKTRAYATDE
jgi:hypothetical protein